MKFDPLARADFVASYSADLIELLIEHAVEHGRCLEPWVVRSITEIEGMEAMESGRCLANAILFASRQNDYDCVGHQVVVGYATPATGEHAGVRLAHAWVVDPFGEAWDVTWRDTTGDIYVGVGLERMGSRR